MSNKKLDDSLKLLKKAIRRYRREPQDKFVFAGFSKCFEVAFEYIWKYLKSLASEAGMEVYSPRDSIKGAAQLGIVEDLELWNQFLNARNLSVHDYISIDDKDLVPLVERFLKEAGKILKK